jgi:integrase
MARTFNRLTDVFVKRETQAGLYSDGGSLYLRVRPTGTRSWIFRYRRDGKLHDLGLGPVHTITLASARRRAQPLREQRDDGIDPLGAKKAAQRAAKLDAAKAMTFAECAEAYIAAHQAGWRNAKHAAQWMATLSTYAFPIFGRLPVQAVDVGLVMKALEQDVEGVDGKKARFWDAKPETASRVRGRIEGILDWATVRQYRQGENPARWRGHLESLLPEKGKVRAVKHHAAAAYAELPAFLAALRQQEGIGARALEFAILTAGRTGEVLGARWDEIDQTNRLWIIPGSRMKAGKEHRVPLSDAAMAIVSTMAELRHGDFVFPGGRDGKQLSNMAMNMTLRRMKRDDLTAHGFRSTFSDWCAEQTNFPAEVREMALAHAVGDKVEAAYRRGDLFDKRRQLAHAWAAYCDGADGGDVVSLRSRASAG